MPSESGLIHWPQAVVEYRGRLYQRVSRRWVVRAAYQAAIRSYRETGKAEPLGMVYKDASGRFRDVRTNRFCTFDNRSDVLYIPR